MASGAHNSYLLGSSVLGGASSGRMRLNCVGGSWTGRAGNVEQMPTASSVSCDVRLLNGARGGAGSADSVVDVAPEFVGMACVDVNTPGSRESTSPPRAIGCGPGMGAVSRGSPASCATG